MSSRWRRTLNTWLYRGRGKYSIVCFVSVEVSATKLKLDRWPKIWAPNLGGYWLLLVKAVRFWVKRESVSKYVTGELMIEETNISHFDVRNLVLRRRSWMPEN